MAEWSITRPRIFDLLSSSTNVLLAGCGGGYDVLSSLPLYFALKSQGKSIALANLSFTSLRHIGPPSLSDGCYVVTSSFTSDKIREKTYFPELYLAQWLKEKHNESPNIYCFDREIGGHSLSQAYKEIVSKDSIDAIVLVDGGTDSLMLGSEYLMGTPAEDHCSMMAANSTSVPVKILACLGFGVDSFHGVSHGLFLENVATIERAGGFYGTFNVSQNSKEGRLFIEAYEYVSSKMQSSIVCSSITDAMKGHFGNHHSTKRTGASILFINSLMTIYWTFDLGIVVSNIPYANRLLTTPNMDAVDIAISENHKIVNDRKEIRNKIPLPM